MSAPSKEASIVIARDSRVPVPSASSVEADPTPEVLAPTEDANAIRVKFEANIGEMQAVSPVSVLALDPMSMSERRRRFLRLQFRFRIRFRIPNTFCAMTRISTRTG